MIFNKYARSVGDAGHGTQAGRGSARQGGEESQDSKLEGIFHRYTTLVKSSARPYIY